MAGFTWDDVEQSRNQSKASEIRDAGPATYKPPVKDWKDPGMGGAFMQAVDYGANRIADGINQLRGAATKDEPMLRGLKAMRESETADYKRTQDAYPWTTGFGEAAPYALVPGGPMASALGIAGMEALSYGTPAERLKNATLGGATAYVGGKVGEKAAGFIRGGGGPAALPTREAVAAADRLGMPLSVGQRTGIEGLQRTEDVLARAPGSSGVFAKQAAEGQRAVNNAIGGVMGATPDRGRLTQDVVSSARDAFNVERNALKAASSLDAGSPAAMQALNTASTKLANLTDNLQQEAIGKIQNNAAVRDIVTGVVNKRTFTGEEYQALRTALKDATDTAYKAGDTQVGGFYKALRSGLDDIAQQGQKEAWRASDVKAATLKLLEDTTHVWNPATGDVSPKNFANRFSQVYGAAAKEGRLPGTANDVLLAGKGLKTYPEGSQTGTRAMFNSVADMALGLPRYGAAKVLTNPMVARGAEIPSRLLSEGIWASSPRAQALAALTAQQAGKGAVAGGLLGAEGPYLTGAGVLGLLQQ